jgi:protein phosphatase
MKLSITADSQTGCVRRNNEDMVLVVDKFLRNDKYWTMVDTDNTNRFVLALADGMGGHNGGEVASSDVLHNFQFFFSDLPQGLQPGDINETIYEWLQSMNNIVDSKGLEDPRFKGMGTTLVALVYYNTDYYWLNCGDSRLYLLSDNSLRQLTTDHSLNQLLGSNHHSNIITNCIGGGCKSSYIDIVKCTADITPGSSILLCSDGLTDMVAPEQLTELMLQGCNATQLCEAAIEQGGYDNVSACVVKVF